MTDPTTVTPDPLGELWEGGYSIPELWGFSKPITRATSFVDGPHGMLWGTLSMVEYQVDKGAGHKYLRDRLLQGDWIAIGYLEPKAADAKLCQVPKIENAQFGRKPSAVGNDTVKYIDVRIVHVEFLKLLDQPKAAPAA